MALKALLIAIRYFDTDCQLDGCHQDADDIAAYLHTTHFTSIHTVVMKDQQDDNTFQQPLCPTLENMITQMKLLIASAVPGDTLLVTYSGHGSNMRDTSGDEKDGRDECLCPVDYATHGMLVDDQLRRLLVDPLPDNVKLRVVFDSCHSGSALDLPFLWKGNAFAIENDHIKQHCDVVFLSGCKDVQTSADSAFEHPNGALTYALLKTLKSFQQDHKKITWRDMDKQVTKILKQNQFTQRPQLGLMDKTHLTHVVDLL